MPEPLLEVKDLRIHFFTDEGAVKAVDGVDLTIERGKTLCLVGESGCGKSVTSRAFLKIVRTPGKIVGGQMLYHQRMANGSTQVVDVAQMDAKGKEIRGIRGKEIAMIFQEPMSSLSVMHTVGSQIIETILLHEKVSKQEARNRAIDLLRLVEIPKPERLVDEYPFRLSGGMRQRAMIAMALSCNPTLLIADEPTTALDVTTQAQILKLMRKLQADYGMAMLFITHDLELAGAVCDRTAVMYAGQIVEQGPVEQVLQSPLHPYTRLLLASVPDPSITDRAPITVRKGLASAAVDPPEGCRFVERCPLRIGVCSELTPELVAARSGQSARCHVTAPSSSIREDTNVESVH